GEWVVRKMNEWGIADAALEPWPADPTMTNNGFPRGWSNARFYLHAISPNAFPITGMSIAWTPGTNGLVRGECVLAIETDEKTLREKYAGRLRGTWVLAQAPAELRAQWDPVARRYTKEQLDAMESPPAPPPARPQQQQQAPFNRTAFFQSEGALGLISTNKGQGVVNVFGGSRTEPPDRQI